MGKLRPFVRKDSYMPNKKWIPFVIGNGYTTVDGASGPAPEYETVTGNPVSFNAITPFPLRQLSVAFSPVQAGSGDPSPDNVRPISGWSSLTVEQRGKNLWNGTLKNGHVDFSTVAGATYTVSAKMVDPSVSTYFYIRKAVIGSDTYTTVGNVITNLTVTPVTFTAEAGYKYALWSNSSYVNVTDVQLELGSTAHEYVPYNPSSRSISISLGQTVYSGTVDVCTGVGEVTHEIVDLGTLDWTYYEYAGNSGGYSSGIWEKAKPNQASLVPNSVCTELYPLSDIEFNYNNDGHCFTINQNGTLKITYPNVTDAQTLKSALNGVMLCYELRNPIPIQLTPQEVESLAGDNTMWSNANQPITVEYRKN